jgi:DNA polymerase-3 subunit delta
MKLSPRDANAYFNKPDDSKTGVLIYGGDAMRVALKRQQLIANLIGPKGDEEMRLTRIPAADLRKDGAMLMDAIKAVGFFPGARVAFVEDANDTVTPAITQAVESWQPGDAQIVITGGALKPTSKLRKLFEGHASAYAAAIYDEPMGRDEISSALKEAGLQEPSRDVMDHLNSLSRTLDPGDFRQTVEKIGLYKRGDTSPLSEDDIAACAPTSTEAALDDVLNIVADGKARDIGPVLRKLQAQGANPVSLCIGATRHFRGLYVVASDPGGPNAGIGRVFPRPFGPRRDAMIRQATGWGAHKLETALTLLTDTDLQLRSAGQTAPNMALVERMLIRLAMLGAAR